MRKNLFLFYFYVPQSTIKVTGDDAFPFLQGQFTNELRRPSGAVTYGLWLNQKGRVLADSYVLKESENEFTLLSVSSAASTIMQRLEQYIVADNVVIADETKKTRGIAMWGNDCDESLKNIWGGLPESGCFIRKEGLLLFEGRRSITRSYEIIGSEADLRAWRETFIAEGWTEATDQMAERERISSATPAIPMDVGPSDLPNEAGLEAIAISFNKGCYLGQEVMARLKNLGQVRRGLKKVGGKGEAPKVGTDLFQRSKRVGEIRSSVPAGAEFIALAMLTRMGLDEKMGLSFAPSDQATADSDLWIVS